MKIFYSPSLVDTNSKNTQYTTTKYIDAMFVHASHGCQCLNNKFQTRWLSDNTDLTPRHL